MSPPPPPLPPPRRWRLALLVWLGGGLLLTLLAFCVPAYWRALAPEVVSSVGDAGAAEQARLLDSQGRAPLAARVAALAGRQAVAARPLPVPWLGGPDPFFEAVAPQLRVADGSAPRPVAEVLLASRANRQALRTYLGQSANQTVQGALALWGGGAFPLLLPAGPEHRQALESALLLAAMLAQGEHLGQRHAYTLLVMMERAAGGDPAALRQLDQYLFDLLAQARRVDWGSLTALYRLLPESSHAARAGALLRSHWEQFGTLYLWLALTEDAPAALAYLEKHLEEGWRAAELAVRQGRRASRLVLAADLPLVRERLVPSSAAAVGLAGFVAAQGGLALAVKAVLLAIAALCFVAAGRQFLNLLAGTSAGRWWRPWTLAVDGAGLALVAVLLAQAGEPKLFDFPAPPAPEVRISFATVGLDPASLAFAMNEALVPTIILTSIFLAMQAAVYVLSVRRLRAIQKMESTPAAKLAHLENEDLLFDFGLYIGLIGTAVSFILLSLNLMPGVKIMAYVSTLMGISFVAVLKIFQVRPYKRQLLNEVHGTAAR